MIGAVAALLLTITLTSPPESQSVHASTEAHRAFVRGTELESQQKLDEAAQAYQQAIQLDPQLAVAHDRLGFVYGLRGRTADAVAQFERARAADPNLFDAQYHLGATLWWTGEHERALE